MFQLMGLDHIVLKTNKLTAMLQFYCDILGCTIEKEQPAFKLTQLRLGASILDLIEVDDAIVVDNHNMDHFCIQIKPFDYQALKQYFDSKDIDTHRYGERYGAQGLGYSFFLKDPEGNELELKEYAVINNA